MSIVRGSKGLMAKKRITALLGASEGKMGADLCAVCARSGTRHKGQSIRGARKAGGSVQISLRKQTTLVVIEGHENKRTDADTDFRVHIHREIQGDGSCLKATENRSKDYG